MRTSHWAAALPMPKENEILIREMTSSFRRLVMEAGFDLWKMTHHCNRSVSKMLSIDNVQQQQND